MHEDLPYSPSARRLYGLLPLIPLAVIMVTLAIAVYSINSGGPGRLTRSRATPPELLLPIYSGGHANHSGRDHSTPVNHSDPCPRGVQVIFWVHTRPASYYKRQILRRTWGNAKQLKTTMNLTSILRFFVGLTGKEEEQLLAFESEKYWDIVRGSYFDSYKNLTYKAISGLRWIVEKCNLTEVVSIVKSDDDAVIDIPRFLETAHAPPVAPAEDNANLTTTPALDGCTQTREDSAGSNPFPSLYPLSNTIVGRVVYNERAVRKGKYAVHRRMYRKRRYPAYCIGLAMILAPDVIPKLLSESYTAPFLWIDDVYFSGILAKRANVRHASVTPVFQSNWNQENIVDKNLQIVHVQNYSENRHQRSWLSMSTSGCRIDLAEAEPEQSETVTPTDTWAVTTSSPTVSVSHEGQSEQGFLQRAFAFIIP